MGQCHPPIPLGEAHQPLLEVTDHCWGQLDLAVPVGAAVDVVEKVAEEKLG